jgi:molybdopterin-guanine dinucleotide biosynthesis protein B
LAVIGRKSSGKTTVIEHLIPELIREGFSVATVKHIGHEDFSIDREGSDTWRHSVAGANPVIAFSNKEISMIIRSMETSLEKILKLIANLGVNLVILEGFSSAVLEDRSIGKIICVRSMNEYEEFKKRVENGLIAFCSLRFLNEQILDLERDHGILIKRTLDFIKKRTKVLEILNSLPKLDCGKCGREKCEDLAKEICDGLAKIDDCIILRTEPALNAKITIDGKDVPLQPFVSEFVRKTVLGMVSSLKNVNIKGDEKIRIEILKK